MDVEEIDTSWIDKYEQEETYYSMFYPEEIKELRVSILYINNNKELVRASEKLIKLTKSNEIQREELLHLIKQHETIDHTKYKLLSILIYNFTLKHGELKNFLMNNEKYEFMASLKHIDNYKMESTIGCLHEINNMFIIFNELEHKSQVNTKRVRFNIIHGKTRKRDKK